MRQAALARFEVSYRTNVDIALADDIESSASVVFEDRLLWARPQVTQYFLPAGLQAADTVIAVQDRCDVHDFRASMSFKHTLPTTAVALSDSCLPVPLVRREAVHLIALQEAVLTQRSGRQLVDVGGFVWGPWLQQRRSKWRIDAWPGADVYLSIDRGNWGSGEKSRATLPSIGIEANFSDPKGPEDLTGTAQALLAHAERLGIAEILPARTLSKVEDVECPRA